MKNEEFERFVKFLYNQPSSASWISCMGKELGAALHKFASINSKKDFVDIIEWAMQSDKKQFIKDLLFVGKIDLPKIESSDIFGMPEEGVFQVFDYDLFYTKKSNVDSIMQSKQRQLHYQEYSVRGFQDAVRKAKKYTNCFSDSFNNAATFQQVLAQDQDDTQPMNLCVDKDEYYCRVTVGQNLFYYDKLKNRLFLGSFIERKNAPSYMTKPTTVKFKSVTDLVYHFHNELHKLLK